MVNSYTYIQHKKVKLILFNKKLVLIQLLSCCTKPQKALFRDIYKVTLYYKILMQSINVVYKLKTYRNSR